MQRNDLPRIGVLSADAAAIAQFLRRIQALDAETAALLPLSPGCRARLRAVPVRRRARTRRCKS